MVTTAGALFPPHVLREYSLIADGERGALIGPRGDIAWLCVPTWHDDAVFSVLLGGPGVYALAPTDRRFTWGGYYEHGTLIWRSRWVTTTGIVECREALAFPGDRHTAVLLRRVLAVDGDAQVTVRLDVAADFGAHPMQQIGHRDGIRTLRAGPLQVRWSGAPAAHHRSGRLEAVLDIPAGHHHDLVLEIGDNALPGTVPDPGRLWERTEHAWHQEVPRIDGSLADRDTRHAYAVLRGLTSSTGGMVAAATTALPERAEQGRNYDYRYCWIRDQCYAGHAVAAAGPLPLLDDAVGFVSDRLLADGPDLKPAYTVGGGRVPDETTLDLPGYPGGDARTGNWVNDQFQLDNFGEALLLLAAADRHDRLDREHWKSAEIAVAAIEHRWRRRDAGIWELRNEHWAHSRLICAAGLRAIAAAAPAPQSASWSHLADRIVTDTARDCVHHTGRWQRTPRDERVDAALLLPALRGALPASDPRTTRTLAAVRSELGRDGYVYRFRQDERPLADAEGAFLLCGFLLALAEHQQGRDIDAVRWFERNRAACGSPALFTEEFDVIEHQLRGNLPQAFVHALLLESAHRLARPWPADP
ncbi:possible glycosyl hydrolase (plasmid) [Rhodococcus jostii RHA1]|jgi:GH15 family glucan-1,4-alpha-glucosidase|nr:MULTISPECIES: glycoside hydrolase family 15 protein [Rhodococcus]ABG99355.1 possible glycosyl hydrolase [Rhodococcus jostii RHA1]QQZ18582.1 glycoside hydrolase family 15 protein [Rhodococcus sp. 21391]